MKHATTIVSVGKVFDLAAPAPGNGVPAHHAGYKVRILEPLCGGYVRCMLISPWGADSHSALIHPSVIVDPAEQVTA